MISDFFYLVLELKKIPRKGWISKAKIKNPESVADHTYAMAMIAMVLSDIHSLDTQKILKMVLLHDLAESVTGDFTPDEISKEDKSITENEVMKEILSNLPEKVATQYSKIWQEYEESKTNEAILVHDIDKLEMGIQAIKYSSEGASKDEIKIFIESAKQNIISKELLEILDTLLYK